MGQDAFLGCRVNRGMSAACHLELAPSRISYITRNTAHRVSDSAHQISCTTLPLHAERTRDFRCVICDYIRIADARIHHLRDASSFAAYSSRMGTHPMPPPPRVNASTCLKRLKPCLRRGSRRTRPAREEAAWARRWKAGAPSLGFQRDPGGASVRGAAGCSEGLDGA